VPHSRNLTGAPQHENVARRSIKSQVGKAHVVGIMDGKALEEDMERVAEKVLLR